MQEDKLSELSELLSWSRRLMTLLGVWPKDDNNLRFALSFLYILIFQTTQYVELLYDAKNGEEILLGLFEISHFTLFPIKFAVFHNNRILAQMIDMMNEDCAEEFRIFKEHEESTVYYSVAKTFNKIARLLYLSTTILYSLKPLIEYLSTTHNGTTPFVLPFRAHIFYKKTDIYMYAPAYTYQVGALVIVSLVTVPMDGLLITLTVHVWKQLSILAMIITDITKDRKNVHSLKIRSIVKQYLRLIWMAKRIDKEFSSSFLYQVLFSGSLICVSGYQAVISFKITQTTMISFFLAAGISTPTILYGYCFIGEILIEEVVQTAMGYVSVLSTVV